MHISILDSNQVLSDLVVYHPGTESKVYLGSGQNEISAPDPSLYTFELDFIVNGRKALKYPDSANDYQVIVKLIYD